MQLFSRFSPSLNTCFLLLRASVKVLQAGVEGPCLHRPENWLVRQLNYEPKLLYKKWDLLERKERLQLEKCSGAQKLVACCSSEGWGFYGRFNSGWCGAGEGNSLAVNFKGFLKWTGLVSTFIGGREQSWKHFAHQPCGRSIRLCISPLGCRNAGLHLLRMQEWYCSPWEMGYSLICLRSPDPTNPPSETSTQLLLGRGMMTHLATSCWQWGNGGIGERVLFSGVDPCSLKGLPDRMGWRAHA
jgi:hypothetical protein